MPELNPLSNEQIFLKKIAENTGSNYNTGDVSEINPLTIDQILLKEIAANTAEQAGDIAELEEKVTANTSAIEAIVDEYGAKNLCPNDMQSGTQQDVVYTVNADGSISLSGTALITTDRIVTERAKVKAGAYIVSGCPVGGGESTYLLMVYNTTTQQYIAFDSGSGVSFTIASDSTLNVTLRVYGGANVDGKTFYPMIRDARITDPTYVPYSMTNGELTEGLTEKIQTVSGNVTWDNGLALYNFGDGKNISILSVCTINSQNGIVFSWNRAYGYSRYYIKRSDNYTGSDAVDIVYTENPTRHSVI